MENYVSHDKKNTNYIKHSTIFHIFHTHTHIYIDRLCLYKMNSYVKHNKNIKHKAAQNIPHIPDIYRHIVPYEAVVSHSVLFSPSKNVFPCMLTSPFAR